MAQGRRNSETGNEKTFWQRRHVARGKQPEGATAADGMRKRSQGTKPCSHKLRVIMQYSNADIMF